MNGALQYEGKRVIVTGAASATGAALVQLLVELGAEVHTVDASKPDVSGIASFTECDCGDDAQIGEAARKIGSVVNAVFDCAGAVRTLIDAAVQYMLAGSAIACVAADDDTVAYVATQAERLAGSEIRVNCVRGDAGAAWVLAFLNSPRTQNVTGQCLTLA